MEIKPFVNHGNNHWLDLIGGFKHEFDFPFHIDNHYVILPIGHWLSYFSRLLKPPTRSWMVKPKFCRWLDEKMDRNDDLVGFTVLRNVLRNKQWPHFWDFMFGGHLHHIGSHRIHIGISTLYRPFFFINHGYITDYRSKPYSSVYDRYTMIYL